MKAQVYAHVAPRIHALRGRLVKPDFLRSLIELPSWSDFLRVIRDTRFGRQVHEKTTPIELEKIIYKTFLGDVKILHRIAPKEAKPIAEYYRYLVLKDDLTTIAVKLQEGEQIRREDLILVDDPLVSRLYEELSVAPSMQRFLEIVRHEPVYKAVDTALKVYQETGESSLFISSISLELLRMVNKAIDALDAEGRRYCRKVMCFRNDYTVASFIINGHLAGMGREKIASVVDPHLPCHIDASIVNSMVEVESAEHAVSLLKQTRYSQAVTEEVFETLDRFRQMVRSLAWRAANTVINGSPFHAGYILAGLEASLIEAEDMISVATGKYLGLEKEEILKTTAIL